MITTPVDITETSSGHMLMFDSHDMRREIRGWRIFIANKGLGLHCILGLGSKLGLKTSCI